MNIRINRHSSFARSAAVIRGIAAAFIAGAACTATASADTIDASAFAGHFDIMFPGYAGAAPLTDFPVLVRISAERNGFNYSTCAAGGADLRFADAEGNLLPCEIDTWNTSGESLVWVKVPSFSRTTRITAYYGCADPPANTPSAVWSNGFVGVWHLGGTSLPLGESSGVSTPFSAIKGETAEVLGASGILGGAVDFSSATTNRLEAADTANKLDGFTDFTIELWTKQESSASNQRYLLNKCTTGGYTYRLYKNANTTKDVFHVFYDGTDAQKRTGIGAGSSDMISVMGYWNHQVFIRDFSANTARSYLNGSPSPETAVDLGANFRGIAMVNSTSPLYLGNTTGNNPSVAFPGQIDELRISNVARSADWVQATHDCVADADFAAYGVGNDWTKYARKFTVSFPGAPDGTLTDFPVLVKVAENSPAGFSYADCLKPEGRDLRFADAAGNLLACEVDTWNTNGVSAVWVKIPALTASTKITAYYGWAFAPPVDATNVWDSGYVGVWHLGESALPLHESSGTSTAFTESDDRGETLASPGAIGGAVDFTTGTTASRLKALDDGGVLGGFNDFTVEIWTKQAGMSSYRPYLLTKVGSQQYSYIFYQNTSTINGVFRISTNGVDNTGISGSAMIPEMNEWTHQVVVRNTADKNAYCYMNGSPAPEGGVSLKGWDAQIFGGSAPLTLGNAQTTANSNAFPGQIDELRISKVARSEEWVKATHDTAVSASFARYSATRGNNDGMTIVFR